MSGFLIKIAAPAIRPPADGRSAPCAAVGYARVSTYGQTLDAQLEQLGAAGCAKVYREKATGAQVERRELQRMLKALPPATW